MNSFDRATGTQQWTRDLLEGSPEALRACGYSSSPLAYQEHHHHHGRRQGTRRGRARRGDRRDVAWQSQDFENGYSSPILIDLDGRPELVVFTYGEIAGLDPDTGALEWSRPHKSDQGVNVATPIWGSDHLLFVSSAYGGGSRVLKLARTRRHGHGRRSLGQPARPHPLRQRRADRRPDLRVERRHGLRAVRGDRRHDRRYAVARSQRHPRDARRRRRPADPARRGRQPRARHPGRHRPEVHGKAAILRSAPGPRRRWSGRRSSSATATRSWRSTSGADHAPGARRSRSGTKITKNTKTTK